MARTLGSLPLASAEPAVVPSSSLRFSSFAGEQLSWSASVPKSAYWCRRLQSALIVARDSNGDNVGDQIAKTASLVLLSALSASSIVPPAFAVSAQDITSALLKDGKVTTGRGYISDT